MSNYTLYDHIRRNLTINIPSDVLNDIDARFGFSAPEIFWTIKELLINEQKNNT